MTEPKTEVLTGSAALSSLIPPEDRNSVSVKTLGDLKVGDHVDGLGKVISAEPGKAPIIKTDKGEVPLDKQPLDYPVSVVKTH